MAKTRQRTSPTQKHWEVYHLGRAGKRLGTVEAADAQDALHKAIDEFGIKLRDVSRTLVRETGYAIRVTITLNADAAKQWTSFP